MAKFRPPNEFDFTAPAAWPEWKTRFARYRTLTKLNEDSQEIQVSTLLYAMGAEAEKIYDSFTYTANERADGVNPANVFDIVLRKFDEHFIPSRNIIHERSKFHRRNQLDSETIEQYVRALYELAAHCDFRDKDETIRDRIVLGIKDQDVSQKLQLEPELTLKQAIDTARHYELVKS